MTHTPRHPAPIQRSTSPSPAKDSSSAIGVGQSSASPRKTSSAPRASAATGCSTNSTGRSAQRSSHLSAFLRSHAPFASSRNLAPLGNTAHRSSSNPNSSATSPTPTFHLKIRNPASAFGPNAASTARPAGKSAATPR